MAAAAAALNCAASDRKRKLMVRSGSTAALEEALFLARWFATNLIRIKRTRFASIFSRWLWRPSNQRIWHFRQDFHLVLAPKPPAQATTHWLSKRLELGLGFWGASTGAYVNRFVCLPKNWLWDSISRWLFFFFFFVCFWLFGPDWWAEIGLGGWGSEDLSFAFNGSLAKKKKIEKNRVQLELSPIFPPFLS